MHGKRFTFADVNSFHRGNIRYEKKKKKTFIKKVIKLHYSANVYVLVVTFTFSTDRAVLTPLVSVKVNFNLL